MRTLVIDDNAFDRRRLIKECRATGLAFDFAELPALGGLHEALESTVFDLALIDYRLPDGDGLRALEQILAHPRQMTCATIMVAGDADSAVAVEAMKRGCADYIEKGRITVTAMNRAVVNAIQKSDLRRDITTVHGMNDAISRMLDRFAEDCVTDMKPVLSRMLRQVRAARRGPDATDGDLDLERSCRSLWEFLERIENYSEGITLRDVSPD